MNIWKKWALTCIAASDSKGSILVPDGFKVQELIDWKQKEGSVVGYPGSKEDFDGRITNNRM